MNNNCCPIIVPEATAAVVEGTSVTFAVTQPTTAPVFGTCYNFRQTGSLNPTTGQEVVEITIGGTTAPLVDNCGRTVPAQMLQCRPCPVYRVQYGVAGTEPVFFARRGFRCRRTTTVAPTATPTA